MLDFGLLAAGNPHRWRFIERVKHRATIIDRLLPPPPINGDRKWRGKACSGAARGEIAAHKPPIVTHALADA